MYPFAIGLLPSRPIQIPPMTVRIVSAALATTILSACSQGQKEPVALMTQIDSVSYAIGTDIGANFKRSKLENVNIDALSMGLRDGIDSAALMDPEVARTVIQTYMMKLQEGKMAEERAKGEANRVAGEQYLAENAKKPGVTTTPSGLQYEVITMGKGAKPLSTDQVKVHYVGMFIDGTKFQSSVDDGEPVVYPVTGFVPGWVEALQLMPVGSKWKLTIPSDLAYGAAGGGGGAIPANSTLVFELELLDIIKQ